MRPTVLVVYREDHEFVLDTVIPRKGATPGAYDMVLASQPWRARTSAKFKAEKILGSARAAASRRGGRLLVVQSYGHDPGAEVVRQAVARENTFPVGRGDLLDALQEELGAEAGDYDLIEPARTTARCSATRCTRCRRRSATGSAPRRCSRPGTR